MATAPEWIFNISDPTRGGRLESFTSQQSAADEIFIRNDGNYKRFRLVQPSSDDPLLPWADVDTTGAVVEFAIGAVDLAPTGGTFSGSSNGDTTGLTSFPYNVSAATLQAALNTNPNVTAGGATVAVSLVGTSYIITWSLVGVRSLIVWTGTALTPESTCVGYRVQTGTASVIEIQVLRLVQRPYAYVAPTTAYPVAASTITQIQTGSGSLVSIQRMKLDPAPYSGSFVATIGGSAYTIPYNCSEDALQTLLGAAYIVDKTGAYQWDITWVALGAQTAIAIVLTGLSVPTGLIGSLNLSTVSAAAAFAASSAEYISAILEGSITFSGLAPITFYRKACTIYRDVIDFATLIPTPAATYYTQAEITALLANYQPRDSDLTAIAALATAALGRSLLVESTTSGIRGISDSAALASANAFSANQTVVLSASAATGTTTTNSNAGAAATAKDSFISDSCTATIGSYSTAFATARYAGRAAWTSTTGCTINPTTGAFEVYLGAVTTPTISASVSTGTTTYTGAIATSSAGAASLPPFAMSGTWYSGGTATTTKPQLLIEQSTAVSTGWSTSGTGLGVNAAAAFVGNLLDLQLNGVSKFSVTSAGSLVASGSGLTNVILRLIDAAAGSASSTGAGGAAGSNGASGAAYNLNVRGGNGGASTTAYDGGAGGAFTSAKYSVVAIGGPGGASGAAANGGAGGAMGNGVTISGGAGGLGGTTVGATGGVGGAANPTVNGVFRAIGGAGGAGGAGPGGAGGNCGPIFLSGGAGGAGSGTSTGGAGGTTASTVLTISGGAGGVSGSGGNGGAGGSHNSTMIFTGGAGGTGDSSGAGVGGAGGATVRITGSGGNGGTAAGGSNGGAGGAASAVTLSGGNGSGLFAGGVGGAITVNGGNSDGAAVGGAGGAILTNASGIYAGGNIRTDASATAAGGTIAANASTFGGGTINISGGASAIGGSLTMNNGGGSLVTTGTGSLQLGIAATRTTLTGAATAARTITFQDADGVPAYVTSQTFITPIIGVATGTSLSLTTGLREGITSYTSNGAITIQSGTALIGKSSAAAMTIAAPSTPAQDGTLLRIISSTNFAHVITFTGATLYDGTTGANTTVTMTAFIGSALEVLANNGTWLLVSSSNVTSIA